MLFKTLNLEAVVQWCSVKTVFLEILQNSQENTGARTSFFAQVFACEFCEISKNTFLHRTPLVAASVNSKHIAKLQSTKKYKNYKTFFFFFLTLV